MKYILQSFSICLLIGTLATAVVAQEEAPQVYLVLNYMNQTAPGYGQVEQQGWAPIHQERVNAGNLLSWSFFNVWYGTGSKYSHVTVEVYPSLAAVNNAYGDGFDEIVARAHPDSVARAELMAKTPESRDIVRTELWTSAESISQSDTDSRYLTVGYMKVAPGKDQEYLKLESEIWKPVMQAFQDAGELGTWGVYQLMMPGGTRYPYNYAAVQAHDNFEDIGGSPMWDDVWSSVHPDVEWSDVLEKTVAAREGVRNELWVRQARAQAEGM